MVADVLARRANGRFKSHRARAHVVEAHLGGHRVVLAKPATYMNESGGPVAALRNFFDVPESAIVVVHDELDLPPGIIRMKHGGGDNGHNGLRSITRALATREYLRVRFGIGRPPGRTDPADFVLHDFAKADHKQLEVDLEIAADMVEQLLSSDLGSVQNRFHPSA